MEKPLVVNVKRDSYNVYIGRPSIWGNPFRLGSDGNREQVIKKYAQWVQQQPHLMAQVHTLQGCRLGCHCAPLPCHGDVLAKLAVGERV